MIRRFHPAPKLAGLLACLALVSCTTAPAPSPPPTADYAAAIRSVLARDTELGTIRNHAPESGPLADSVRDYVRALDGIDFSGCPADFRAAFARHRDAWSRSIEYFDEHDGLRGEMHDLFDAIHALGGRSSARLEVIEAEIWDTWAQVEAAAKRHGAGE